MPIQLSLGEELDIGMDVGSTVDFTYEPLSPSRARFKVEIELKPQAAARTSATA